MKLNHLNLTVSNVPETHRFLEKYFGLKSYVGTEPREAMSFLSDDDGMVLALFRVAKGAEVRYPAGFHVGFIQSSPSRFGDLARVTGNSEVIRRWLMGHKFARLPSPFTHVVQTVR